MTKRTIVVDGVTYTRKLRGPRVRDDVDLQAGGPSMSVEECENLLENKTIVWDRCKNGWALKPRVMRNGPSILVIGPDGVGKTTIVSKMSKLTGIPTFKCPTEKMIFTEECGKDSLIFDATLTFFLEQTGHRFISDRAYPCEWVYSRVFGRETDDGLLEMIDERHAGLGTKILYLYSSTVPVEPDDIVPADKYFDVKRMYDRFFEWTGCSIVRVDTCDMLKTYQDGGDSSDEFTKKCMDLLGDIF